MTVAYHFSFSYCRHDFDYNIYFKLFSPILKKSHVTYSKISVGYFDNDSAMDPQLGGFKKGLWDSEHWWPSGLFDPVDMNDDTYVVLFHHLDPRIAKYLHKRLAKNARGFLGSLVVDPEHEVQKVVYLISLYPRFLIAGHVIYVLHNFDFDGKNERLQLALRKSSFDCVVDGIIPPTEDGLRFLLGP